MGKFAAGCPTLAILPIRAISKCFQSKIFLMPPEPLVGLLHTLYYEAPVSEYVHCSPWTGQNQPWCWTTV